MKTFSDEALAALQRGDAIVSASVEIIPLSPTRCVGITVSGFDPADTMRSLFRRANLHRLELRGRDFGRVALVYQALLSPSSARRSSRGMALSACGAATARGPAER
jgi:hypothetical protein